MSWGDSGLGMVWRALMADNTRWPGVCPDRPASHRLMAVERQAENGAFVSSHLNTSELGEMDLGRFDNRPLRRRDFQFSLARMLVAMTLCAVLLSLGLPLFLNLAAGAVLLGLVVVVVLFCDWSEWHVMVGSRALYVGNHARAIPAFTRAIKAKPEDPARYYCRAVAHSHAMDLDAAIHDYGTAIELDPRYAPAWIGRAEARRQRGEYKAAIDDASIGLCTLPADPDVQVTRALGFVVRGSCYLALRRTEEAFEELEEAVRMAPNDGMAYSMRGFVRLEAEDYEQALSDLDKAVERGANSLETLVSRAVALFRLGRYEAAFRQICDCCDDCPQAVDALRTHAWFLATCPDDQFRNGRRALALAASARGLATADDWACQASVAAAYAELGQFDDAVEHAEKAHDSAPAAQHPKLERFLAAYKAQQPYRDRGLDGSN